MSIQAFLNKMRTIHESLLDFIDNKEFTEENLEYLLNIFDESHISSNHQDFMLLLRMISNISKYHNRGHDFFKKIDSILQKYENEIKDYPNWQIFNVFKSSKRILLFLLKEEILKMDDFIAKKIMTTDKFIQAHYRQYFCKELKPFMNEKWLHQIEDKEWVKKLNKELPNDFEGKRERGENDSYICKLIQEDLIDEFIAHVNMENCSLDSIINASIYETNNFLLKKQNISMIEYAAFFGSIQIFQYLRLNKATLGGSLYSYAFQSNNQEMIHLLEETYSNYIIPYEALQHYVKSIASHHNDIATYIQNKYLENMQIESCQIFCSLKYHNFGLVQQNFINQKSFCDLCKYDYYTLVDILLNDFNADVNDKIIYYFYY